MRFGISERIPTQAKKEARRKSEAIKLTVV
jgi:hypothetical protein